MRTSPVILAIAAAAIGAIYGCSLPLEGLPANAGGTASAGGAPSTVTGMMTAAGGGTASSTSTGVPQCTTQSDCPSDLPCVSYACTMGQCVAAKRSDGMQIPDEPGNCKETVCMDGVLKTQTALGDIADDSDPCTSDTCDDSGPLHGPGSNGSACGPPGKHCLDGQCRDCASDGDCSDDGNECASPVCNNGTCEQKNVDGLCKGGSSVCFDGSCCPPSKLCYLQCCSASEHCTPVGCKSN